MRAVSREGRRWLRWGLLATLVVLGAALARQGWAAVDLVFFKIGLDSDAEGYFVRLVWETATEIDNNYFEIYRRRDQPYNGSSWFDGADFVVSRSSESLDGLTGAQYEEIDRLASPTPGRYYYVLKSVDVHGGFEVHEPTEGDTYVVIPAATPTPTSTPTPTPTSMPTPTFTPGPTPTWTPTSPPGSSAAVRISFIDYHPAQGDLNEYVQIDNMGDVPVDITGWRLRDDDGNEFVFPGYILDAKASILVWTKPGTDNGGYLYWDRASGVWDNEGETAYLYDRSGRLVSQYSYQGEATPTPTWTPTHTPVSSGTMTPTATPWPGATATPQPTPTAPVGGMPTHAPTSTGLEATSPSSATAPASPSAPAGPLPVTAPPTLTEQATPPVPADAIARAPEVPAPQRLADGRLAPPTATPVPGVLGAQPASIALGLAGLSLAGAAALAAAAFLIWRRAG